MLSVLITAAVVPAVVLLLFVYKQDKLEKEPRKLLLSLVFLGIASTFLAMITELLGGKILANYYDEGSLYYNIIEYFIVVACSEEGFKYLLLRIRTWRSKDFNCQFDGVIYSVFVSLGFALWENIGYALRYGLFNALVRAVTAVPGHACFGVFMGTWYGISKRYANNGKKGKSIFCRILAFALPVVMHGAYDFIATNKNMGNIIIFIAFILIMFTISFILVKRLSKTDKYIVNEEIM